MNKIALCVLCTLSLFFCTKIMAFSSFKSSLPQNDSIIKVFKGFNSSRFDLTIQQNDSASLSDLNKELALNISQYINQKYKEDLSSYVDSDAESIILLGFLYHFQEMGYNELSEEEQSRLAPPGVGGGGPGPVNPINCIFGAVTGLIGIPEIKAVFAGLSAGATSATVFAALRLILRRVGFGIAVGLAIINLGECLGVW